MIKIYFYKITCKDESIKDLYIGQTKDYKIREACHKSHCDNINDPKYNMKLYKYIRDNGGWNNWTFQIFCNINCIDIQQSKKIETFFIKLYNANLNVCQRCKKIVTEEKKIIIQEKKINDENIIKSFIESNIIKTNDDKNKILRGDLYKIYKKCLINNGISSYIKKTDFFKIIDQNLGVARVRNGNYYYFNIQEIKDF